MLLQSLFHVVNNFTHANLVVNCDTYLAHDILSTLLDLDTILGLALSIIIGI
jgi:hypothetical protein